MAKKDKDATVLYKSPEGKKLLKEAGINPEKWPEYRRLENWEPGYGDLKDRLVSGKAPEIRVTKSELEKIRKAFEDSKKFNDPEFRKKILDNLGENADVKGILEEDENYPPSYQELYNKYKDFSFRELLEQPDFLEYLLKPESERMKLDLPYLKEKARKEAEEIDLGNIPEEERESYLKKKEVEILKDLKKNYNSGLLSPGELTFFSNEGDTYDVPKDEKGLNKLAKGAETYENWIKENTVPAFDSIEDIKAYLDEHYPEESKEEQLESLAENEPEVAIENKDLIPHTAKEAEQVIDDNPHNDEANNEEIKKDVGEFIKPENGMLKKKKVKKERKKKDADKTLVDSLNYYNNLSDSHKALMDQYYENGHGIVSDFDRNMHAAGLNRLLRGPKYEEVDEFGNMGDYSDEEKEYLSKLGFNLNPQTIEDVEKLFNYDPTKYVAEEYRHPKYDEEYDYIEDVDQDELEELIPELKGKSAREKFEFLQSLSPKEREEKAEEIIESYPQEVAESSDVPQFKKEAEDLLDDNKSNDEVNNEEIKKALNSGFEDGLLKRDEEQQKEFDRIKEESARKAEEWRQQQFDKFANREPEEVDNVSTEPQIGEQPAEDLFIDEDAYLESLKPQKKKKMSPEELEKARAELDGLEFNPEEDFRNDIDYKPSKEELEVLNKANREEWEANGRPRNKDLLDKTVVDPNQQVEDAIESNPVQAEQVAEDTLGEGNPIEEEAEQVNDDIPQNDEVNNNAIESASDEDKSEFLNAMEDVVDYGLEDQNYYGLSDATLDRIKNQTYDSDKTIVQQENNLPDLDIEQIPEKEMRKLFDPLNKEIEARQKRVSEADEALQLAQMHFDENPNEENAKALEKANQTYKDAEFSLKYKQKEYASAYENLGNYYRPKEDEPYFIKEVEKEPHKLPNIKFGKGATANGSQSSPTMDSVKMGGKSGGYGRVNGPSAGLGRIGGFGSISPVNVGSNKSQNAPYRGYNGKAGGGSVPTTPNKSAPVTGHSIPHSNGSTVSSGAGMLLGKHTNYTPPTHTAPIVPILGHTSNVSGNGSVPQIGGSSKSNPKLLLISQLEAKLNELTQKNPKVIEKLGFDHKYKHWAFKGIALDELTPNQLNDLLKEVEALN